jgi:hypothetical protein
MSDLQKLMTLVGGLKMELERFEKKGTKVSATRSRATLLQIKKLCDQMRKDILAQSKQIPTRSRKVKEVEADEPIPDPPVLRREQTVDYAQPSPEPVKPKRRTRKKKD